MNPPNKVTATVAVSAYCHKFQEICGRYRLKDPQKAFGWMEVVSSFDFLPRFNIAPTQRVPVVTSAGQVEPMTWGIVPV